MFIWDDTIVTMCNPVTGSDQKGICYVADDSLHSTKVDVYSMLDITLPVTEDPCLKEFTI